MKDTMSSLKAFFLNNDAAWVSQVFIVVLVTLLIGYVANIFMRRVLVKFQKTKNMWDDALIISLRRPLQFLIWTVGISFAIEIIYKESGAKIFSAMYPLRDVLVIAIISWFASRFIREVQSNIIDSAHRGEKEIDRTTVDALSAILRAAVIITAALITMQTLGFSVGGVLAFGGVGGIAIGFAAKDMLANFFGALMIYFDRPFQIGDWIRSPDKDIEGTVEDIGWRQTRIRTFDKRPLYVPNSVFSTISVENASRMTHRRIKESISLRYEDIGLAGKITGEIKDMLMQNKDIDNDQTLIVNIHQFSPSSVDLLVQACTHATDIMPFYSVKHEIMMKISEIIAANGAQIAYPTTVQINATPAPAREA